MPGKNRSRNKQILNRAKQRPISEIEAKKIADSQIFLSTLNADYEQIMLRISNAPTGLTFGAPPGKAT